MFWKRKKVFSYKCACCGEKYSGSPSFAMQTPPFLASISDEEYEARVEHDDDLCLVRAGEGQAEDIYAIRVTLEVPIHGVAQPFTWGVWVTQSKESFRRYLEGVGTDERGEVSFGWLPVVMFFYTRDASGMPLENLACDVLWQDKGLRPKILLHESDHVLARDQKNGISWERAVDIAQQQMARLHA